MSLTEYAITLLSYIKQTGKRKLIKEAWQLRDKTGLEIGGPTAFFGLRGGFPVYLFAGKIDGVNFSNETMWEGKIKPGETYRFFKDKTGFQYIAEATDLSEVKDGSYDFVLSSHSLEHVANPVKALKEWLRVLKTGGKLILVLPDKMNTFDHRRSYTTLEHMVEDYQNNTSEHDTTHFDEIIRTHDSSKTGYTNDEFVKMLQDNYSNRCAHHHVFDQETIQQLLNYAGFTVLNQYKAAPFHLIAVAEKKG